MRYISIGIFALVFWSTATAQSVHSVFRDIAQIRVPSLKVPTVIEVPLVGPARDEHMTLAIERIGGTGGLFEPLQFQYGDIKKRILHAEVYNAPEPVLTDGLSQTFKDFEVNGQPVNTTIRLELDTAERIHGVQLQFAEFSPRPTKIQISTAADLGLEGQMLLTIPYSGDAINFPERILQQVFITVTHEQTLRLTDITLLPNDSVREVTGVRFLAQPGAKYRMFSNPDRYVSIPTSEMPYMQGGDIRLAQLEVASKNERFIPADTDSDGITDVQDNCASVANPLQEDIDSNGVGDACDDFDRDGYMQLQDNCPLITNRDQQDSDGDKIGDACDAEESRFSEQYPWLPWAGMGLVVLVLLAMTFTMMHSKPTAQ
ncbi:MAG: hypothetical protein RI911_527 [Candidatus Parcubacteria bacterium]|jgi:hypothetical protein